MVQAQLPELPSLGQHRPESLYGNAVGCGMKREEGSKQKRSATSAKFEDFSSRIQMKRDAIHMMMIPQVNVVCLSAMYHIKNIGKIRRFLDRESCERIVHAFVTSRLDLNNALLTGIAEDAVTKLQKVQNIEARVVTRMVVRDHITPVLN